MRIHQEEEDTIPRVLPSSRTGTHQLSFALHRIKLEHEKTVHITTLLLFALLEQ
jgi:hypothetical protein